MTEAVTKKERQNHKRLCKDGCGRYSQGGTGRCNQCFNRRITGKPVVESEWTRGRR